MFDQARKAHLAGHVAADRDNSIGLPGARPSAGKQAMRMLQPTNLNVPGKARRRLEHSSNRAILQRTSPHHCPLRDREGRATAKTRAEHRCVAEGAKWSLRPAGGCDSPSRPLAWSNNFIDALVERILHLFMSGQVLPREVTKLAKDFGSNCGGGHHDVGAGGVTGSIRHDCLTR
jgi:hypothetical protein